MAGPDRLTDFCTGALENARGTLEYGGRLRERTEASDRSSCIDIDIDIGADRHCVAVMYKDVHQAPRGGAAMHRTQIDLDDGLHSNLKARARRDGVSMSELIRVTLQAHVQPTPAADAQAFFQRLRPLDSFAQSDAANVVRALRSRSRLLRPAATGGDGHAE